MLKSFIFYFLFGEKIIAFANFFLKKTKQTRAAKQLGREGSLKTKGSRLGGPYESRGLYNMNSD